MKRIITAGIMFIAGLAQAASPVALTRAGELDAALMDHLKKWAGNELALPVPLAESLPAGTGKLEETAAAAAAQVGADELGLVVLDVAASVDEPHGIFKPEQKVVVINVADMRENAADEGVIERRLERQVIRGICVLMGLEWSPNPQSAMARYTTLEELDQIGRNLDPPWQLKLHERARELGVPVDPENPYNMLRTLQAQEEAAPEAPVQAGE